MKPIYLFLLVIINYSLTHLHAAVITPGSTSLASIPVSFISPVPGAKISAGTDLDVRIGVHRHLIPLIKQMTIYLNGQKISIDAQYPFEWKASSPAHSRLRNLRPGKYVLKLRIEDRNGKFSYRSSKFYVHNPQPFPAQCYLTHPLQELAWLKVMVQRSSNIKVVEYRKGWQTYFAVNYCHKPHLINWFNCRGQTVLRSQIRGARKVRTIQNECGYRIIGPG